MPTRRMATSPAFKMDVMVQGWSTNLGQLLLNTPVGSTRIAYFQAVTRHPLLGNLQRSLLINPLVLTSPVNSPGRTSPHFRPSPSQSPQSRKSRVHHRLGDLSTSPVVSKGSVTAPSKVRPQRPHAPRLPDWPHTASPSQSRAHRSRRSPCPEYPMPDQSALRGHPTNLIVT